jgi:uncharacterized protein DUF4234
MVERSAVPVFKVDPVMVLVLGMVSCGLYLIYWNIKAAEVINSVAGETLISPAVAALSGCCMPVNIYFFYQCGEALPALGKLTNEADLEGKKLTLLVLAFFLPMVSAMILQGHINKIYDGGAR